MARRWSATGVARRTMTFAAGAAGALALGAQPTTAAELALLGQWRFDESDGQA